MTGDLLKQLDQLFDKKLSAYGDDVSTNLQTLDAKLDAGIGKLAVQVEGGIAKLSAQIDTVATHLAKTEHLPAPTK